MHTYIVQNPFDREVRALIPNHLYTWQVPFFGEQRTAITAIPPLNKNRFTIVRELRWGGEERLPYVDPHLELYSGLEDGKPELTPLEIRLYSERGGFSQYH